MAQISAIFGPAGLKNLMGTQDTIIYRLVVKNPSYDANFLFFGRLLVGKWTLPPRALLMVWGL